VTIAAVARSVAVALAVAAVADPALVRSEAVLEPVTVVAVDEQALPAASRVRDRLAAHTEAKADVYHRASAAAACPARGACVLVSNGDVPDRVSAGARLLGALRVDETQTSVIASVHGPLRVHRDVAATLRVGTHRPVARVDVFDGDVLVGSASPNGQTAVDVGWIPLAPGARSLRIVADSDVADTGVIVDAAPAVVLFYEPQTSWLGTFVRRALEDDPRIALRGRTRVAPTVTVTRGASVPLNDAALGEVSSVVVTTPDLLTASEVDALERFVAWRGGSLIVLTDRRPSGPSLRLLPRVMAEHRDAAPRLLGVLRASEWVTFEPAFGVTAMAAVDQQPVIVDRPVGRGRVVVSGALDAWKYRQADDGFETFWTTLVWDAAALSGPPLRLETDRVVARHGETINMTVALHSLAAQPSSVTAESAIDCDGRREMLRLWPGPRPGTFTATFRGSTDGPCVITANVNGVRGSTPVTIRDDLRPLPLNGGRLDAVTRAHGGVVVSVGHEDELSSRVRERLTSRFESVTRHPTRSPFWMLLFITCLALDWWLQRRSGLS
jgi:hypothetical protein